MNNISDKNHRPSFNSIEEKCSTPRRIVPQFPKSEKSINFKSTELIINRQCQSNQKANIPELPLKEHRPFTNKPYEV